VAESFAAALAGRVVLVCGARFAGAAAVRTCLRLGAAVNITDSVRTAELPELVAAGASFLGPLTTVPQRTDVLITSPGFPPTHPLLVDALVRGFDVLGEVELAWRLRPGGAPWLAVTGTNGKTTTVRMLESMLRAAGHRTLAVGNVGVSIIDAVSADPPYDSLAVELSSFQLHWSSTVRPRAGALLNLAPDHLDWHGSMDAYAAAKTRIWYADTAIGNDDDPVVRTLLSQARAARRIGFTLAEPKEGQLGVRDGSLVDRAFGEEATLAEVADVRPAGRHNVANALAAAALARSDGVSPAAIRRGLRSFEPDPHRNQFLTDLDGVRYVDDSKATNPHAAAASLSAYARVVWIAGGQLKDAPVDDLVRDFADRLVAVVLLGADRARIAAALARHAPDVPVHDVDLTDDRAMTEVVRAAAGFARPGDTVLLAPAAASYDMFSGYAARGQAFAAAVAALGTT